MTGKELYKIRTALRMTQKGLADFLNISMSAISRYEKGSRPVSPDVAEILEGIMEKMKMQAVTKELTCPVCEGTGKIEATVLEKAILED